MEFRSTGPAPLLTLDVHEALLAALADGHGAVECSLDLQRSTTTVQVTEGGWIHGAQRYPYLEKCKERTVYYWSGAAFEPAARYSGGLIKLVPTEWGPPTFEIDGIKMLPTAKASPYLDAQAKVATVDPRGKTILDTCGGLGYFAHWCLVGGATRVVSFEKNADVIWLRALNPWSPIADERLTLAHGDIAQQIATIPDASCDAVLHDPPRFGIAGELYSQVFYDHLARVLKPRGKLFHYTGQPNKLTSGRDVPQEVATRLRHAGFETRLHGDGVLGVQRAGARRPR